MRRTRIIAWVASDFAGLIADGMGWAGIPCNEDLEKVFLFGQAQRDWHRVCVSYIGWNQYTLNFYRVPRRHGHRRSIIASPSHNV